MKARASIAALALIIGACGCAPSPELLSADRARIRLLGRWDARGAPDRLVAVNPGSSFEFRYEGTSCVLHFDRSVNKPPFPQLWVQFDGAWTKHVLDGDQIVLGGDAELARHRVWVVLKAADEHQSRWKPPLVAALTLTGIAAPGGRFLRPPRRRKLIFEAIGDSITEGILVYAKGKDWPDRADSRATYAFQTALALGAEPRIVAFGRQGLTVGGNGGVPPVGLAYPFVCERVRADDPPADIVVINHGGNDAGARSIENGYLRLLRLVRQRNPRAAIFCLIPFAQVHAESIRRAVAEAHVAADTRVYLVETRGWLDRKTDLTDRAHPTPQGHAKAAKRLTTFIRRVLDL